MNDRPTGWAITDEALAHILRFTQGNVSAVELRHVLAARDRLGEAPAAGKRLGGDGGAVAVIPLSGIITPKPSLLSLLFGGGGGGLDAFRQQFAAAIADDDIAAVVLDVDSPGGRIDLVPETAAEVRAAREVKPVIAVANTMAASAAYWIASQASEMVVTPSGQVGSIGVYLTHVDYSRQNEMNGVSVTFIKAGRYKVEGNSEEPLSEQTRQAWQADVDEWYSMFVSDVAAGRGTSEKEVRNGYGQGRMVIAANARQAGLVDSVDTLDGVLARLGAELTTEEEPDAEIDDLAVADGPEDDTNASLPGGGGDPQDRERIARVLL